MPDTQPPDWAPDAPEDWPPTPPAQNPDWVPPVVRPEDPSMPRHGAQQSIANGPGLPHERPAEPYSPPPDGSAGGPPPPRSSRRRRSGCLLGIVVLVVVLVLGVGGCVYSCRGALSGAYKIGIWGWSGGEGPSLQSADTTHLGTQALPQDRMQPDASRDEQAKQGLARIHDGLLAFERDKGRPYDRALDGGWERALEPYVTPWPTDPWTQDPMHEGLHRGDVQFDQSSGELDLTVYISP